MNYTYNPTQWHTGDIITENKLNNIETALKTTLPDTIIIAPTQEIVITSETDWPGVAISLADGITIDEDLWLNNAYSITYSFGDGYNYSFDKSYVQLDAEDYHTSVIDTQITTIDNNTLNFAVTNTVNDSNESVGLTFYVADTNWDGVPGTYTVSITLNAMYLSPFIAVASTLYGGTGENFFRSNHLYADSTAGQDREAIILNTKNWAFGAILVDSALMGGEYGSLFCDNYYEGSMSILSPRFVLDLSVDCIKGYGFQSQIAEAEYIVLPYGTPYKLVTPET